MLNLKAETEAVFRWVCGAYGIEPSSLTGPSRIPPITEARCVAYYLARRRGMSYPCVGRIFKRDHTSVMSGVKRVERLLKTDVNVAALVVKFCAEREAFDRETLFMLSGESVHEVVTPPAKPPDEPVEMGGETLGVSGAMPVEGEKGGPSAGSLVLVPDSAPVLSSGSEGPDSKPAREPRRKPRTPAPDVIEHSDKHREVATQRGLDLAVETERCLNYHRGEGNLKANWGATLTTWLLSPYAKAVQSRGPNGNGPGGGPGTNFARLKARAEQLELEEKRNAAQ